MYADISLETDTLYTPNNVAVLSQMLQLNAHQQSALFQNWKSLPFSNYLTRTVTQHNRECTYSSTTDCKQTEEGYSILRSEVLSMQRKQSNSIPQYLSVSIILFALVYWSSRFSRHFFLLFIIAILRHDDFFQTNATMTLAQFDYVRHQHIWTEVSCANNQLRMSSCRVMSTFSQIAFLFLPLFR
jgi:hypothetical protein